MNAESPRPLGTCWLRGDPAAQHFLSPTHHDPNRRAQLVNRAVRVGADANAIQALRPSSVQQRPKAYEAWRQVADGHAAVVVTGQQAGFLLGPRYTFHKALSTVLIAQELESQTGVPCVPVFWIQDEDHDFAEVATYAWLTRAGELRHYELGDDQSRVPVGDRDHIPAGAAHILDALEADLRTEPFAEEALALINIWRSGRSWSEAFRETLELVFSDERLLVVRGRSRAMNMAAQSFHHQAIEHGQAVAEELSAQTSRVESAGFRAQVPIMMNRLLSFYQPDGVGTPRYRFDRNPDGLLSIRQQRWEMDEIYQHLRDEPMRFSTSALLRPIVQDGVLPVVAQVVGPGEASYLAQLASVRGLFSVSTPMVVPRGQATWIPPWVQRCLVDLKASPSQACGDVDGFLAQRASSSMAPGHLRTQVLSVLSEQLQSLGELSPGLEKARHRTFQSVQRNVDRFVGKLTRHLATQDQLAAQRLSMARSWLLPKQKPQERFLGIVDLVARCGLTQLKSQFSANYQPYTHQSMDLVL